MNRFSTAFIVAASLAGSVFAQPSFARVNVHLNVGIPAPPTVVFDAEPRIVPVPRTHVFYAPDVSDYDMYRVGPYWYINRDGYWYRSHAYRGPFGVVSYNRLPRGLVGVPGEFRHHPLHPRGWKVSKAHGRWKHHRHY